jgi:hypothetical protein
LKIIFIPKIDNNKNNNNNNKNKNKNNNYNNNNNNYNYNYNNNKKKIRKPLIKKIYKLLDDKITQKYLNSSKQISDTQ